MHIYFIEDDGSVLVAYHNLNEADSREAATKITPPQMAELKANLMNATLKNMRFAIIDETTTAICSDPNCGTERAARKFNSIEEALWASTYSANHTETVLIFRGFTELSAPIWSTYFQTEEANIWTQTDVISQKSGFEPTNIEINAKIDEVPVLKASTEGWLFGTLFKENPASSSL